MKHQPVVEPSSNTLWIKKMLQNLFKAKNLKNEEIQLLHF